MNSDSDKEIVPSSVKSVSSNVDVSQDRSWLIYNYGEIYRVLHKIDEIIKNRPSYLLDAELIFLQQYRSEFGKHKIHNFFKLATPDYIHLLTKALEAMESRISSEEEKIISSKTDKKIKGQIVVAFSQLSALLKDIKNTFFSDLQMIKVDPRRYIAVFEYLSKGVDYLIRAYVYDYLLIKGELITFDEIVNFNTRVDTLLVSFNKENFANPVYKFGSEIYEIYA